MALAAQRTGLDQLVVAGPAAVRELIIAASFEIETRELAGVAPGPKDLPFLKRHAHQTLLLGGGLGTGRTVADFVRRAVSAHPKPVVLDGDAIRLLGPVDQVAPVIKGKPVILTPNHEELLALAGRTGRVETKQLAKRLGATIVLKGDQDYVTDGTHATVVPGGSPLLAKGGCGDVYAGIAATLLSRLPDDPFRAAVVASRMIKRAGRLAVKAHGAGVLSGDVIRHLDLRRVNQH
jgi:NAD(P)H-hydrate epimerase